MKLPIPHTKNKYTGRQTRFFDLVGFSLVSLFNGMSNFVDYLIPKPSLSKNGSGTTSPIAGVIGRFVPFPRVFVRK